MVQNVKTTDGRQTSETDEPLHADLHQSLYPPKVSKAVQTKAKKKMVINLVFWVAVNIILFGFVFNGNFFSTSYKFTLYIVNLALILGVFFISVKIHIILHELGHAAAGLLTGRRLVLLSFGRWRYERTLAGFRWRKALAVKGVGGLAVMVPDFKEQGEYLKTAHIIYMLGGVFVNFFCAALFFGLRGTYDGVDPNIYMALNVFFFSALWLGAVNLIPFKARGWETDGFQIWKMLRGRSDVVVEKALHLAAANFAGVRPRQWSFEALPSVEELKAPGVSLSTQVGGWVVRLEYALDVHDTEMAYEGASWLAQNFHGIPDGIKQQVAVLMAVFAARYLKDKKLVKAWRPLCAGGLINLAPVLFWVDAEQAYLHGDVGKTRHYIQKCKDSFPDLITTADQEMLQEQLALLEQSLRSCP